jgi:hypothetical protein
MTDLRQLAERYVTLTGELETVRCEMLTCFTDGAGAVSPPAHPTQARRRILPAAITLASRLTPRRGCLELTAGAKFGPLREVGKPNRRLHTSSPSLLDPGCLNRAVSTCSLCSRNNR